ncbi:M48 family metalloprotease [Sphingorhabdus sp.]|uniref:M48 family metalloprotease n=1 Tax=Sphingorhabdus sp. TaxID=1902408 RepID=UPI002BA95E09|nr:M48 family metalloprotease [Sphingorhabdus sp.]HMT40193.1 M48 family metalloprotease [Sphingorhabdus sp.]
MRNKLLLTLAASALAIGNVSTEGVSAAKSKSSEPLPFSAKEKANGAKYHPEILKEFGGAYQSPQTAYVERVGKKIALQSGLANSEGEFTVTFLNSAVNNAFAIEGGYVYITRQLAALCNSEAEMAGVLGHEVGHTAARHSKKRQKQATIANILGAIGTVGGAMLGDNGGLAGALGGVAREYSGALAQIFTLKYSRGQEEQADDLGIKYLSKAGYDPSALSAMLNSLALQTAVDAKAAGLNGHSVPEWASTHPDPAKRVVRAATNARKYPASTVRNADAHLRAIDGMMYDDDPKEGVIEGQEFLHPDIRLRFAVPSGFGMSNGTQAVTINGNGGKALFTTQPYNGDRRAYIDAAFKAVVGNQQQVNYGQIQQTTVNGIPAFYASADVPTQQSGTVRLTVFAYEWANSQAFHFVTIAPVNTTPFTSMFESVSRLTDRQAADIKPRKVRVVTVGRSDTVATMAAQMAYKNFQTERFLALNGLSGNAALSRGQKVKIVTY